MFCSVLHKGRMWTRLLRIGCRIWLGSAVALAGCSSQEKMAPEAVVAPSDTKQILESASRIKVFFNHQSVGENILSGIDGLVRASGTNWPIVKLSEGQDHWPSQPGLWHATLGENGRPKTKIDAFAQALRSRTGEKPQVAMLKLCFVDVTAVNDVSELLDYYRATIDRLKSEFPSIAIGHVTVPLAPQPHSLKAKLKRLVGRQVSEDTSNLARTMYNRKLREFFPNDPTLDLEQLESSRPDGTRAQMTLGDERVFSLADEYAGDAWGHLNQRGAQLAATATARFILDAAARRAAAP